MTWGAGSPYVHNSKEREGAEHQTDRLSILSRNIRNHFSNLPEPSSYTMQSRPFRNPMKLSITVFLNDKSDKVPQKCYQNGQLSLSCNRFAFFCLTSSIVPRKKIGNLPHPQDDIHNDECI